MKNEDVNRMNDDVNGIQENRMGKYMVDDWKDIILNISDVVEESIVDGPGIRYTIFVQGCPHACRGCHNPQTHAFEERKLRKLGDLLNDIKENPLLYGVTFSGGEPFVQAAELAILGEKIHDVGLHLMCYSGYTYEVLLEKSKEDSGIGNLLKVTDVLVDGPFILEKRDLNLLFRGSTNQRLIDLSAMRRAGDMQTVILWSENGSGK